MTGHRIDARHECEARRSRPCIRPIPQPTPAQRRDPGWGPIALLLALVPILLALGYALVLSGRVAAQPPASPAATERGTRESGHGGSAASSPAGAALDHSGGAPIAEAHRLTAVLARALTVWERPSDGHVVYAHHCRTAPGGCEARLRAIALEMIRAGRAHGVDPWLLAAMAYRESGLNPDAIGAVGEVGVLQLHPRSARGRRALAACARAPSRCTAAVIWLAAEGLAASIARCGSEPAALGAYNRGHCGVTSYSRRVLRQRELLLAWAGEAGSAEVTAAEGEGPSSAAGRGLTEAGALIAGGGGHREPPRPGRGHARRRRGDLHAESEGRGRPALAALGAIDAR